MRIKRLHFTSSSRAYLRAWGGSRPTSPEQQEPSIRHGRDRVWHVHDSDSAHARDSGSAGSAPWGRPFIRELALDEIRRGGRLRGEFLSLHATWLKQGMARWLLLLGPGAARPVIVLGAFDTLPSGTRRLVGGIIGVWSDRPVDRFDDLVDAPGGREATARPAAGAWHLISVTTAVERHGRGLGLGRALLGYVLALLGETGHQRVRTLSPAFGLVELAKIWQGGLEDAVVHAAREDGRPALQVLRLHLGGGARLERVLRDSRRDDAASLHVSLRFCYDTDPAGRALQKERWLRWIAGRERDLERLTPDFAGEPLFRAHGEHDALVWDGAISE
jgi:hypothetical protein